MSSLSSSMATFKIHDEEEHAMPSKLNKLKQLGALRPKRTVLGDISGNVADKRLIAKTGGNEKCDGDLKGLGKPREGAIAGKSVFCDGKQAASTSIAPQKGPLLEKSAKNKIETKEKENCALGIAAKASLDVEIGKPRVALKEISHSVKIVSPMLVDIPKSIKLQLEDLYACVTYKDDIFQYLKRRECMFKPKPYYMKRQPYVTCAMRTVLVDWLVEVGEEYNLSHPTLFQAVSYVDRFLSSMAVVRSKLQLLGTAAMFLAAKFEEIYPPEVSEFAYITDDSYSKKQILRMENLILKVLDFNLSTPTAYTFVMHIAASLKIPEKVMFLAIYISELTLLEADPYLEFQPSLVASASLALARHCLDYVDVWPIELVSETGYSLKQLAPPLNYVNETHAKSFTSPQVAIRDKYKVAKYQLVSLLPHKKLSIRVES